MYSNFFTKLSSLDCSEFVTFCSWTRLFSMLSLYPVLWLLISENRILGQDKSFPVREISVFTYFSSFLHSTTFEISLYISVGKLSLLVTKGFTSCPISGFPISSEL